MILGLLHWKERWKERIVKRMVEILRNVNHGKNLQ
jgi:hypothetical protein